MNTKMIITKAIALGTGIGLLGTTLVGAYDLGTFPAKFVDKGQFSGKIVLGQQASVEDVIGAVDIAASLQATSTTVTEPTFHGVVMSGDVKSFNGGKVQIRKKPTPTLSANDIKSFARGHVTTASGATDYDQYLRIGATGFQQLTMNYIRNNDGILDDYLVVNNAAPFFEWELRFPDGLKAKRNDEGVLRDLQDKTIGIIGNNATIETATINSDGTAFSMTLMGGSVSDTIAEGETKTYTVDGKDYEVTLVFISDPNSGRSEVKFSVNGEMTHALGAGDTDMIGDGLQLGVRDILVNAREGIAGFYLGARKIVFTDPTPSTEDFDGRVEVNGQSIPEGQLQVVGAYDDTNSTFKISWIKYRYTADGINGSPIFMPEDHLLRSMLRRPEGMLSDIDFHYHGILPVDSRNVSITRFSDEQYSMIFYNNDGKKYTFPFISNRDGVWKYGDEKDDLVFVEGASAADCNIGINDYFITSNNRGTADADKSVTHVLRYIDYDQGSRVVTFESESDKKLIKVPLSRDGVGYLIPVAHISKVNVSDINAYQPNLSIDLDANSAYGNRVSIVTYGGLVINPALSVYLNSTTSATLSDTNITTVVGNGKRISDAPGFVAGSGSVKMSGVVLAKKFDTPSIDESFNWTVVQADNNKVDLTVNGAEYSGPLHTDMSDYNNGYIFTAGSNDQYNTRGLTDWGIYIDRLQNPNHPAELTLNVPQTERYTQMFVSAGQIIHGGTPAGTTEKVNPIAVGLAILDRDAPALGKSNMIVIGGPCVNKVAAVLLKTGDNCAEGFMEGDGMIKSFENDGKIAILVAGYSAADTLRASQALANYKKSDLEEDETHVHP